eukprot:scaffold48474_cov34-Phaeocystis_antarctica.AAC.1
MQSAPRRRRTPGGARTTCRRASAGRRGAPGWGWGWGAELLGRRLAEYARRVGEGGGGVDVDRLGARLADELE